MKPCKYCGGPLPATARSNQVYCSTTCAREYVKREWRERNPKSPLGALAAGTIAEAHVMRVCIDLLEKGWQVYRAAFPAMDFDIFAMRPEWEVALRVKVTTGMRTNRGGVSHPKRDRTKFDVLAIVIGNDIIYEPELL